MRNFQNRWYKAICCIALILIISSVFIVPIKMKSYQMDVLKFTKTDLNYNFVDRNGEIIAHQEGDSLSYSDNEFIRKAYRSFTGDGAEPWNYRWSIANITSDKMLETYDYSVWSGINSSIDVEREFSVESTFSTPIQTKALSELSKFDNDAVAAVYNYKTGELLACVSVPALDPQVGPPEFTVLDGSDIANKTAYLNLALDGRFIPGSISKINTVAGGIIHLGKNELQKMTFSCNHSKEYAFGTISCGVNSEWNHGSNLNVSDAFACSCNIAHVDIALAIGYDNLHETMEKLGWTKDLYIEGQLIATSRIDWDDSEKAEKSSKKSDDDFARLSFGQSTLQANPMHMLIVAGTIANNGKYIPPWYIKSISYSQDGEEEIFYTGKAAKATQWIKSDVAKELTNLMAGVVKKEKGTGKNAAIDNVTVCGKTGTAIQGDNSLQNCWFVGFIKEEKYPYAVMVMAQSPDNDSRNVASIAKILLDTAMKNV